MPEDRFPYVPTVGQDDADQRGTADSAKYPGSRPWIAAGNRAGNHAGNHAARITPFAPSLTEPGGHSHPSSSAVLTASARLRVPVLAIAADR